MATQPLSAADREAADKALNIAFRGDTSSIDDDMAMLFAEHRAEPLATEAHNPLDSFVHATVARVNVAVGEPAAVPGVVFTKPAPASSSGR